MSNPFSKTHMSATQQGKGGTAALVVIAVLIVLGVVVYTTTGSETDNNGQNATSTNGTSTAVTVSHATSSVSVNGAQVLHVDDFADRIQVSADSTFGGSDRITGTALSPDEKWIAIEVSGAAHAFGWLYNRDNEQLRPVAFQYGGSVEINQWRDATTVVFDVTSPKPETEQKVINVTDLPEYPRVATSSSQQ